MRSLRTTAAWCFGLVISSLLLVTADGLRSPAFSQIQPGIEINPYVGRFSADGGIIKVIDQRRRREIRTAVEKDGTSFGFRGGYNLNRWLGIEGSFLAATNNHTAVLSELGTVYSTTENNALMFVAGNGVFHLLSGRVAPYLTAGTGILGTIEKTSLAVNYGGGVKVFVGRRVAIRLDARQYRADLTDTLENLVPLLRESYQDRLRFNEVSVGLAVFY